MMLKESLRMSVKSIISNKLRSFLTMLGIIIGVMALIILVSIANGTSKSVTDSIGSMGTNIFTVRITDDKNRPLSLSELTELAESLEYVGEVSPSASAQAQARLSSDAASSSDEDSETVNITGTSGAYADMKGITLKEGRYFNITDVDNHTNVVVISEDTGEDIVGSASCLGEKIMLDGVSFEIIGITESDSNSSSRRGRRSSSYKSYEAYMPYTTLQRLADSVPATISTFVATAVSDDQIDAAEDELTWKLLERFDQDEDAFSIQNQSDIAEAMEEASNAMAFMLGGIAAISLLVGGIGIMNIMLVSVTERTREIGIRKAIGAEKGAIMLQFVIEAMILSLMGCAIGIVGSMIAIRVISMIGENSYQISWGVVLVSALFSSLIGIIFGIYPAAKAANRNPIDALRYTG